GVRTSGRVETEHRVNKSFTGPKKSLFQVFDSLNEHTCGQSVKEMIKAHDSSRRQHDPSIESVFSAVLDLLRTYAGPHALQVCFEQMKKSMFYVAEVIDCPQNVKTWNEY
ncbi:hypothetical protein K435DRAFT_611232, partial [Dendrothele bispora CBS 962.96]